MRIQRVYSIHQLFSTSLKGCKGNTRGYEEALLSYITVFCRYIATSLIHSTGQHHSNPSRSFLFHRNFE
uniref:Uncharacterized protein n=1 Tax=Arundo donax TaxID=35708 RepID=A0A0A9C1V8_ARUDO